MKNIKGYYSWIHSLKEAAMLSQYKGHKMLNEEINPNWKPDFKEVAVALQRPGEAPVINPKHPEDAEMSSEEIFDKIKQEKIERGDQRNFSKNAEKFAKEVSDDEDDTSTPPATPAAPKQSSPSRLAAIQSGNFPPTSAQHPPAEYSTPEQAAAKVRELNAPSDAKRIKQHHQQEATRAAREAVEAARKAGHGPRGQRAAAEKAVEDYKKQQREEMYPEPPESSVEVVTPEGHRMNLPMESVNRVINKMLKEEDGMAMDATSSKRPGTTYDRDTAGELELPRSIRRKIKGAPTQSAIFSTLIDMIDNPDNHDPADVAYADNFFKTVARVMKPEE